MRCWLYLFQSFPRNFFFYNRTKIGGSFMIWFFLWLINFHQRQLRIVWDSEKWQNFHSTKKKEVMIPPFSVFHSVTSRFASVDDGFLGVSIQLLPYIIILSNIRYHWKFDFMLICFILGHFSCTSRSKEFYYIYITNTLTVG